MWFISNKKVQKDSRETASFYEYVYAAEGFLKDAMKKIALVPNESRETAQEPLKRMRNQVALLLDLTDICHTCNQIREDVE